MNLVIQCNIIIHVEGMNLDPNYSLPVVDPTNNTVCMNFSKMLGSGLVHLERGDERHRPSSPPVHCHLNGHACASE